MGLGKPRMGKGCVSRGSCVRRWMVYEIGGLGRFGLVLSGKGEMRCAFDWGAVGGCFVL